MRLYQVVERVQYSYFEDTKDDPKSFDLIATGDLGQLGKKITADLLRQRGIDIFDVYTDCGLEIFDLEQQDVHCGGSGCGCSATVFASYIYPDIFELLSYMFSPTRLLVFV